MRKGFVLGLWLALFFCVTLCAMAQGAAVTQSMNGKRVIFIGNSMIYYGGCVMNKGNRDHDEGIFYHICRANGEEVTVFNRTFGGHHLYDFTCAGCRMSHKAGNHNCKGVGYDLLEGLDLSSFDCVFISESGDNNPNFINDLKNVMARFTNPKTQFFYLNHAYTCFKQHKEILSKLPVLRKLGVKLVNWGGLVHAIANQQIKVPSAKQSYARNTFMNCTEKDKHHPNLLSGYITAQLAYCMVTGKKAEGQSYAMVPMEEVKSYASKFYTKAPTNMVEVFASENDMHGLQKCIDDEVRLQLGK